MALKAPKGMDTRPTMTRSRRHFLRHSILRSEDGAGPSAGSGQIEALSRRGAKSAVVFVDMREDVKVVRENLAKTRLVGRTRGLSALTIFPTLPCPQTFAD